MSRSRRRERERLRRERDSRGAARRDSTFSTAKRRNRRAPSPTAAVRRASAEGNGGARPAAPSPRKEGKLATTPRAVDGGYSSWSRRPDPYTARAAISTGKLAKKLRAAKESYIGSESVIEWLKRESAKRAAEDNEKAREAAEQMRDARERSRAASVETAAAARRRGTSVSAGARHAAKTASIVRASSAAVVGSPGAARGEAAARWRAWWSVTRRRG